MDVLTLAFAVFVGVIIFPILFNLFIGLMVLICVGIEGFISSIKKFFTNN